MYIFNGDGTKWRRTFVFGEPKAGQMYVMCDLLRRIKSLGVGPWFRVGDFNEAMWQDENFPVIKGLVSSWLIFERCFQNVICLI